LPLVATVVLPRRVDRASIHRSSGLTQPIAGRTTALVECVLVCARVEQDSDRAHEAGLHGVVQRAGPVIALVCARRVAQERGHERRIVSAAPVAGAADSHPVA
jgi:hypothetical protein